MSNYHHTSTGQDKLDAGGDPGFPVGGEIRPALREGR